MGIQTKPKNATIFSMPKQSTLKSHISFIEKLPRLKKIYCEYSSHFESKRREDENNNLLKLLCNLLSPYLDPSDIHNPYKPLLYFHAEGRRTAIPEDLTDEELDTLEKETKTIKDPELLSRIEDILWIRRKNIRNAYAAVDNFLLSAENLKENLHHSLPRIERALRLSFSLGKGGKIYQRRCINFLKSTLEKDIPENFSFFPLRLIKLLSEFTVDNDFCISECEKYIRALRDRDNGIFELNKYLETLSKLHEKSQNTEKRNECLEEMAENCVTTSSQEKSAMVEARRLEEAIEIFRKIGGKRERIDELHSKLLQVQKKFLGEMKECSGTIDTSELVNQSKKLVSDIKNTRDALFKFCLVTSPTNFKKHKEITIELMKKHPLITGFIGSHTIDQDGRTIGFNPNSNEIPEETRVLSQMIQQAMHSWALSVQGAILPAKAQILLEHPLNLEFLLQFTKNNPCIRPGREILVAEGFLDCFQDKWGSGISLLVPQFEDSLRYVFEQRGVLTSRIGDDSIQESIGLNEFFKNDYSAKTKEVFGEDLYFDLKSLMTKNEFGNGQNLRNMVAHGLIPQENFCAVETIYFWWLYFRLVCTPLINEV